MKLLPLLLLAALPLRAQTVDELVNAYMKEHGVTGMAVAIVQAPYITRVTGYGLADPEKRTRVGDHTLFDVGAMKHAYTAVAVMQLVEQGKLKLDDVRPLLAKADPTLVQLVEQASGTTYEQFVRKNQFERVGLEHTYFGTELPRITRAKINPTEVAAGKVAPRSIYASARDISLWDIALAGELLIKDPALRAVLYVPATTPLQLGAWSFPGHKGLMITTGSANGHSALLSRYTDPSELVCVTLLANKEGLDFGALAERIAAVYLNAR